MNFQLKTRQVCLFIIAFLPVTKIFILPSILASHAGEDLWLCAAFSLLLDFITLFFVISACKKAKTNLVNLLESNLGKTLTKILAFIYVIYFLSKAVVPLNEQKDYVELTLYTLKPSKLYFLPFFGIAFYFCTKKLRVLGRAADILWLFTSVGIILLLALSIPNSNFEAILPVGAHGLKSILKGCYSTAGWFGDSLYIAFFIGNFEYKKGDDKKIFLSFLIAALMIILFMIIFYCVFTSIAFRQRFALTEVSKYTSVINNIGRFDYLGIVLILISCIFALSIPLFFATKLLNYVFNIRIKWLSSIIVIIIEALIMVVFTQYYLTIENLNMKYASAFYIVFGNLLPIATIFLKNKEIKNETRTQS